MEFIFSLRIFAVTIRTPYTMCCSFLPSLTLFFLLISVPCSALPFSTPSHGNGKKQQHNNNNSSNLHSTNMDPFEVETLFKIMETLSSDSNWRVSYPSPCKPGSSSWIGLECKPGNDNHVHVSRLDFGTKPNPTCKKTATFPSQIFDLPYLESVFFFRCFTQTKTTITITPGRISTTLTQLSFRSNQAIIGPIPPQISSLKSLQVLTLSQNRLHGQIPAEIFSLSSLVHLDLSYNLLTGTIPNQLGSLVKLEGLDLSYNLLTGPIPNTIGQLGLLQKLDLSSNSITGRIPDTIENLHFLVFMALGNNKLKGNFPKGIDRLQNLQYLIMEDNPMFVQLPFELGRLAKLQELRLANSGLSGAIPPSFSRLLNLSTLSLQNNRLTGPIPVTLSNLTHIYHMNLSKNLLVGVVPFNLNFLQRLGRNLDLSGNSGLCLDKSDAYASVKIGVGVCGSKGIGSLDQPLKRSEAPVGSCRLFNVLAFLGVWGMYQMLFYLSI